MYYKPSYDLRLNKLRPLILVVATKANLGQCKAVEILVDELDQSERLQAVFAITVSLLLITFNTM